MAIMYPGAGGPNAPFKRVMAFIDGENLVFRYQEMLKNGHLPKAEVSHMQDVFVWATNAICPIGYFEIERANYYTYAFGDEPAINNAIKGIKSLTFANYPGSVLPNTLHPIVFRKPKGSSGKGVDIQLTVDAMIHSYHNNFDILYLVSGDGDYKPMLEEVVRSGKKVFVASLSSGLSPLLKTVADRYYDLDKVFFK